VVRATGGRGAGWLGSTAGLTGDGQFVALARFESEEAARRNSVRPEQDQWWMETSKLFVGEVIFRDSSDVTVDVNGDPDKAGFVQVMQGRGSDPDRARELMAQNPDEWAAFRPDVIGSVTVAREGERKQPPPQLIAQMDEMSQLIIGETEFLDLRQPWLYSP